MRALILKHSLSKWIFLLKELFNFKMRSGGNIVTVRNHASCRRVDKKPLVRTPVTKVIIVYVKNIVPKKSHNFI